MSVIRRRIAGALTLGLVAVLFLAVENQGLADNRPITWRVIKKNGTEAYLEAEGGTIHHVLYGDQGGAELTEGDTIELQCKKRNDEWRCTRDTYRTRMVKLGGAFALGVLLLGLVLSPEIRERLGK